ncbi:hypothetical protein Sgleb_10630 [Streptomyces glebosus]|uniref:Uncharacterized protein n=1 Tax=Streptomyces glebosus TaxID=249580 RepID=A0A640SSD3_9ACTN|nr:hypothetical protein Sgleb_10630 [Streptomyces glebosus]GHG56817.1 hypothetical protein GCM10010513_19780 [Streptomyces glebosus]
MGLDDLSGGDLPAAQSGGEVGGVELVKRVGHQGPPEVKGRQASGERAGGLFPAGDTVALWTGRPVPGAGPLPGRRAST